MSSHAIAKIEKKGRAGPHEWNGVLARFSIRDILNGLCLNAPWIGRVNSCLAETRTMARLGALRIPRGGMPYPRVLRRAQRKKHGHQSRFLLLQNPNPAAERRMNKPAFS